MALTSEVTLPRPINTLTTSVSTSPAGTGAGQAASAGKGTSKFGRILGSLVGGALGVVAPGAGTVVGELLGLTSLGPNTGGPDFAKMEAMLAQTAQQQMQMLGIQTQVQNQMQEFTTITNLMKAHHEGEMAAIHNIKS